MTPQSASAADQVQVGGDHYKKLDVQPWTAMEAWMPREQFIGFLRGNAIKYLARAGHKDDLGEATEKARHYLDKLIEVMATPVSVKSEGGRTVVGYHYFTGVHAKQYPKAADLNVPKVDTAPGLERDEIPLIQPRGEYIVPNKLLDDAAERVAENLVQPTATPGHGTWRLRAGHIAVIDKYDSIAARWTGRIEMKFGGEHEATWHDSGHLAGVMGRQLDNKTLRGGDLVERIS